MIFVHHRRISAVKRVEFVSDRVSYTRRVSSSKETGLEVNAVKTEYMFMSRDQKAGRSHSMKSGNSSFEWVGEFIYLRTILKKSKFYSGRN
jgi:hypothetical protein